MNKKKNLMRAGRHVDRQASIKTTSTSSCVGKFAVWACERKRASGGKNSRIF